MEADIQEIERHLPRYKVHKLLGTGSFACVYLVSDRTNQKKYAIKKISCFGLCDYQKTSAINEAKLLSSLNHPNIIKLNNCIYDQTEDNLFLLMEFANEGDLNQVINKAVKERKKLPQDYIWGMIEGLADGLTYMHANNIVHRDIKPGNVFMSAGTVKIADMNVSKQLENGFANTKVGSPNYISPEVWAGRGYSYKCDLWSLGVMIYELCEFGLPFEESYFYQMQRGEAKQRYIHISREYTKTLQDLVNGLLRLDQAERMSSKDVKNACIRRLRSVYLAEGELRQSAGSLMFDSHNVQRSHFSKQNNKARYLSPDRVQSSDLRSAKSIQNFRPPMSIYYNNTKRGVNVKTSTQYDENSNANIPQIVKRALSPSNGDRSPPRNYNLSQRNPNVCMPNRPMPTKSIKNVYLSRQKPIQSPVRGMVRSPLKSLLRTPSRSPMKSPVTQRVMPPRMAMQGNSPVLNQSPTPRRYKLFTEHIRRL